jgi:serine phosphatase RsbU (regulator of sigma subunit)
LPGTSERPGAGTVDFARIFAGIPTPYLVMTPDLVIADANDAYLANVGRTREDLVGRPVFEAFPPEPDTLDDHGTPRIQVSFERAIATCRPDTMPLQRFDIPDPATGGMTVKYWSLISVPILGADGTCAWLVQRAEDVTDFVNERERAHADQHSDSSLRRRVEEVEMDLYARAQELAAALAAQDRTARRLASLGEVALQLTSASTVEDLEQIVVTQGLPVLGADGGAVISAHSGGGWRITLSDILGEQVKQTYGQVPYDSPLPPAWVARNGQRLLLPTRASGLAFDASMADVYADTARLGWAFLPLTVRDECLGALAVAWVDEHPLPVDELELLDGFAAQCAQALQRIRATEAQREAALAVQRLSETLQRSLLTQPPAPDDLQIAVRYQPAAQEAQVGGDWYDAFVTAAGSTLLVIGDVTGHDRDAAAAMGQVRNLLRGIAYDSNDSPAVILTRLDEALRGLDLDTLATAVLARVEQSQGDVARGIRRLRWSNAGHLPPLLRHPDGTVGTLTSEPDLLLGLHASTMRSELVTTLLPGATLVLYTDGLVERRDASLDEGIHRLAEVLTEHGHRDPEVLADILLERIDTEGNNDDIALLVLRAGPRT